MPAGIAQGEAPPLFAIGPEATVNFNYRVRQNYYIVISNVGCWHKCEVPQCPQFCHYRGKPDMARTSSNRRE
jgi:hypothetical protein